MATISPSLGLFSFSSQDLLGIKDRTSPNSEVIFQHPDCDVQGQRSPWIRWPPYRTLSLQFLSPPPPKLWKLNWWLIMRMWPSLLPIQCLREKQPLHAVTIMWAKRFPERKENKECSRTSNSHAPSPGCRPSTSNRPWKTSFSTHNPGYALRSFPLYTFLFRGGYFYILTLENHDESSEESFLGQTKPVSASTTPVATHPPGNHISFHLETPRWVNGRHTTDAAQQNSPWLWL